ncbi:MAG: XRE family transcriptional regulator [Candidatus Limimorpha sp.]
MDSADYHIGKAIKEYMKKQGRTEVWLARGVHCDPGNFNRTLKKPSIDMDLLRRISLLLEHNFCMEYAKHVEGQLRKSKPTSEP